MAHCCTDLLERHRSRSLLLIFWQLLRGSYQKLVLRLYCRLLLSPPQGMPCSHHVQLILCIPCMIACRIEHPPAVTSQGRCNVIIKGSGTGQMGFGFESSYCAPGPQVERCIVSHFLSAQRALLSGRRLVAVRESNSQEH